MDEYKSNNWVVIAMKLKNERVKQNVKCGLQFVKKNLMYCRFFLLNDREILLYSKYFLTQEVCWTHRETLHECDLLGNPTWSDPQYLDKKKWCCGRGVPSLAP